MVDIHEKVLVTGALGQLGSSIKRLTEGERTEYIFTDYEELDITKPDIVNSYIVEHKPGIVINCAAYTAVDKAESEPEKARLLNTIAVQNLANACQNIGTYLFHVSTDYVFDGKGHRPYREDDTTSPTSVYGQTKLEGEQVALAYEKSIVVRTSWLYSIYGNNFVKTMLRLGAERSELNVVFDQIGSPTNAADLAEFLTVLASQTIASPEKFHRGIYHFSNEGVCSWYDFARKIMELGKRGCKINPIETKDYPTPAKRPHYSVLNKHKLKADYSYSIPHWEDSLKDCVATLIEQEQEQKQKLNC